MGLEGYTGPTSGRITIGGDGEITKRETFTDPPLTRDERDAVAWFTELSPNEQLRQVRIMKWNLDEAQKGREQWKGIAEGYRRDLAAAERKLAMYPPEGYALPGIVSDLLGLAKAAGWRTGIAWTHLVDLGGEHSPADGATVEIVLGHGLWLYRLRWHCDPDGGARMTRGGLAQTPDHRAWHDAPSVKKIRQVIADHPSTSTE